MLVGRLTAVLLAVPIPTLASQAGGAAPFVSVADSIVALTNARVIDGTGRPAAAGRTIVIAGDRILGIADRVGTVEAGKQADLVVLRGDPSARPADIRNVVTVFRRGTGYDSAKLLASVRGLVGLH